MKKLLLGSTALVVGGLMAAPAMAADPIKMGVGGYYTFYGAAGNIDPTYAMNGSVTNYKGFGFIQEGEIHFIGQTKLDNGTSVGLTVELEAWNPSSAAANAQMPAPYRGVSDFDGPYERPYGAVPPAPPPPAYNNYGGYGPSLLPLPEVYAVLRDNGFSPLGIPRLRGFVYTIAVIDRGGEDGRLVIDARNGRIIRFLPAYRTGDNDYEDQSALRGPVVGQPPRAQPPQAQPPQAQAAPDQVQAVPRPSRPAHVANRSVPMPKASPIAARPAPASV